MYDSDEEEDDTFNVTIDETRDDHIKKNREDEQERRGSRYALLRSLAWSQDEELDGTSEHRMESQSDDTTVLLCTLIADTCTVSPPPSSMETSTRRSTDGRSSILWTQQQVQSDQDLDTIICRREKSFSHHAS
jgi:hypothetical protein